jgi:hypothetical protein
VAEFEYWVGMQIPPASEAELAAFNAFYTSVHVGEVVARHSFLGGARYELLRQDPRGDFGPPWLARYFSTQPCADAYIARNGGPPPGHAAYTAGPPLFKNASLPWRMMWRPLADTGAVGALPASIFMVGMNVPAATTEDELATFNDFYTNVHVPEVMSRGGFSRACRYELYRDFRAGCPRFCAVYESASEDVVAFSGSGPMTPGPPTWEAHDTLWRLWYRRIASI